MTQFLHGKRVSCSVYGKSLRFCEKKLSRDVILQRQALADVFEIDVLKNFSKFTGKYHYQILHLKKLQAWSLQLYFKRDPDTCFPVNFLKFLRAPFLKNSFERLFLTLQIHKVDKSGSRYCNKDIKMISAETLLVTLCQL